MLAQHPRVFVPRLKEPQFYSICRTGWKYRGPGDEALGRHVVSSYDEYQALFRHGRRSPYRLDASTHYLPSPTAASDIAAAVPNAKIIIVLRDPVARAQSAFRHLRRDGHEVHEDLVAALRCEARCAHNDWSPLFHYRRLSLYGEQVGRYQALFPADQLIVLDFADLTSQPLEVMRSLESFLDLPAHRPYRVERSNADGVPRSTRLHRLTSRPSALRSRVRRLTPAAVARFYDRAKSANMRRPDKQPASPEAVELLDLQVDQLLLKALTGWAFDQQP
jgi:hypothetical protein